MKALNNKTKIILGIGLFFVISIILGLILYKTQNYPLGNDVYGHWFKTNVLYNAIKDGTLFPTYTNLWYNGVDLFRYWPPASYYFLSFIMFFTNGYLLIAYPIFVGIMFFIGACGWLLYGNRENKIGLSIVLGILFFFLPDNMRVFFSEGNSPRIFITSLLPYLFFFVFEFVKHKKKYAIIPITLISCLILFTHVMIAAMIGISTFLVLLIYSFTNKEYKESIIVLIDIVCAYLTMGIILIPSLIGGIVSQDSSASVSTSADWSRSLLITLNPFVRYDNLSNFYFGLSLFLIILLGLIISTKEIKPFFASTLIILLSTSTAFVHIISMLPLSQVFWMQRFIPMACTFALIGLLYWKRCRKITMVVLIAVIIIDCIPSLMFFDKNIEKEDDVLPLFLQEEYEDNFFLKESEELVQNRVALLDLSSTGSYPSYYYSQDLKNDKTTQYMFGWAIQGAYTKQEIVKINESFEYGFYTYTFDRLIEMGCDIVIVQKREIGTHQLIPIEEREQEFLKCAEKLNYEVVKENDSAYLLKYKLDNEISTFGTITNYEHIAIGEGAYYISYLYPTFKLGDSSVIDEYSMEELSKYKKIYLSGFSYKNKEKAEKMLMDLSNQDIDIYIDMNNIPTNELTQKKEFLDVYAQFVTFTQTFPIITTNNGSQFKLEVGTKDYSPWYCTYLSGDLKDIRSSKYGNNDLIYYGKAKNDNIHFMGFNLLCYCISNKEDNLINYLNEIFELENDIIPNRQIVPIEIDYDYEQIKINSKYDNVNTNLANLQGFQPTKEIIEEHHLIKVSQGETILNVKYPYFVQGLFVSCIGFVLTLCIYGYVFIYNKKKGGNFHEN